MNEKPTAAEGNAAPLTPQERDARLSKIERILKRMLLLAEISAGGGSGVDRKALQRTMERLKVKLDKIADELD